MVRVGDCIETPDGIWGYVTHIEECKDGRFIILYQEDACSPHCVFLEGDKDFKLIE